MKQSKSLQAYLSNIGEFGLISESKEIELAEKIAEGCEDSLSELAEANLRLVVKISYQFGHLGVPLHELIAEGNEGLMKAAQRFRPGKGAKFSSYAAWWIKQAIRRAIANHNRLVRVPVQSLLRMQRIKRSKSELEHEGIDVTTESIAERSGVSHKLVRSTYMNVDTSTLSLESEKANTDNMKVSETIPDFTCISPDVEMAEKDSLQFMRHLVESELTDREQVILQLRFGLGGEEPKTLEEVSECIGRTRERVRQLQYQALEKLRRHMSHEQPQEQKFSFN